ncbi:MAG: PHP domain-containing protein [Bacilli bacterium]|nr:PHP domain-containing protein [Bacilli bacterium]
MPKVTYDKSKAGGFLIDLHIHSNYSDGSLSPNQLIELARDSGVGIISITDHDTLLGNQNIVYNQILESGDVKIIPGIELSAKVNRGRMHILGYDIDIYNKLLNKKMEELRGNSLNSVLSTIEQIKRDYGIIFSYEELIELINAKHNLGRPDIAKLCVKKGYASTIQEAFEKYLIEAYRKVRGTNKGLSYEECIELILRSGGIPVLAHPCTLGRTDAELLELIKTMISCGLMGIEVYHSNHNYTETAKYLELANQFDLLISGGTDFHGDPVKPDVKIGTGRNNNIKIKQLSLFDKIRER